MCPGFLLFPALQQEGWSRNQGYSMSTWISVCSSSSHLRQVISAMIFDTVHQALISHTGMIYDRSSSLISLLRRCIPVYTYLVTYWSQPQMAATLVWYVTVPFATTLSTHWHSTPQEPLGKFLFPCRISSHSQPMHSTRSCSV